MAEFKSNHYVPEMLLKRFMSDKGEFFYFDKRRQANQIQHRNPKTVFCENNLYVAEDKAGERDVSLERDVFSKLESNTQPILDKIINAVRKSELPKLTLDEKKTLDEFLFQQWRRTPDSYDSIITPAYLQGALESSISEFERIRGKLDPAKIKDITSGSAKFRIIKSAKIAALKISSGEALDALQQKGIGIAKVANSKKSFIVGSFPVVKLTYPGRANLDDPTVEVWLPISHDIALTPWGITGQEKLVKIDSAEIRKINELIYGQSTEIAGRSAELIRSLVKNREIK